MNKKVLMFGSYVSDLTAYVDEMPVPGQTLRGNNFRIGPGGKGSNQGVAAHRAGTEVIMAVRLGKDMFSELALDFYRKEGISCEYVTLDEKYPTGTALITVDNSGQNEIVVIPGACDHFNDENIELVENLLDKNTILLTQLEINDDANEKIIKLAKSRGAAVILNPAPAHPLSSELLSNVDILTPNETEAQSLSGINLQSYGAEELHEAAESLFSQGVKKLIITMGSHGAYCNDGVREEIIPICKAGEAIDCTGAGDAFNGGLAAALAKGYSFFDSARYASAVAGLSVTRLGTAPAMPFEDEVNKLYAEVFGNKN